MAVRVGVDVGGTFTKAVALDAEGAIVARAVVPTSHDHPDGVAAGVVGVIADLAGQVGPDAIELVTHSTTQAVNALLEGDVPTVGVLGMAAAPYVRKARKRARIERIELTDGRQLNTVHEFLEVTGGLDAEQARLAVGRLIEAGCGALAVSEAFAPDDTSNEEAVAAMAAEAGVPATTSAELTGLYGLELRTLTAAVNASILPIALRTAEIVGAGVAAAGVHAPVMVMRGDGGATDLDGFRKAPARTLYSGPAASVAGALRTGRVDDAVIIEVGGTSTNVAAIHHGRPALSYVQVGRYATAVRALDVRVTGVAGGSMLRVRKGKVHGVGPRSAHIAGLAYACFTDAARLDGAEAAEIAPRPGDQPDHLVLRLRDGASVAITNTCAANALGLVAEDDYAFAPPAAAVAAFEIAGRVLRLDGAEVARRMLAASTEAIAELVSAVAAQHKLRKPVLVAVGGGAGTLGRAVAQAMRLEVVVPPGAEVISSVGDALSLVRAERERTLGNDAGPAELDALVAEVEAEVLAAGAAPTSIDVQVVQIPDRGAVRAVATGALVLASGTSAGRDAIDLTEAGRILTGHGVTAPPAPVGAYWLASDGGQVMAVDRFGDVVIDTRGTMVSGPAARSADAAELDTTLADHTRHMGPVAIAPTAWVVRGSRLTELNAPSGEDLAGMVAGVGEDGDVAIVIGRS